MESIKLSIKNAFKVSLPVMAGYLFLGFTFGLLMNKAGFDMWVPLFMSLTVYSGALEFAAIPFLSGAFDPIGAFVLGITLSARHLFYGLPMLKKYEGTGKRKPFLIFGLTDETFSILSRTSCGVEKTYCFFVTLFNFIYWVTGTALGVISGSAVNFDLKGLDFALTALFIVLFLDSIKTRDGLISGSIGLLSGAVALVVFGKSWFIIASMVLIITALSLLRGVIDRE